MIFKKSKHHYLYRLSAISIFTFCNLSEAPAKLNLSPEKKSVALSKQLKDGIEEEKWNTISINRQKDKLDILKGDTLFGISKRLFGDPMYWPKIWEINNETVKNPHFIYPGNSLYFSQGTATSLPFVEVSKDAPADSKNEGGPIRLSESSKALTQTINTSYSSSTDKPGPVWDERTPRPPEEWKNLPRQNWENINVQKSPTIDKDGFDSSNRQIVHRATGLEQDYLLACEALQPLGTIVHGRSPAQYFNLNDEAAIEANQPLENGQIYSVVSNPTQLESGDRSVKSYLISGAVKILGVNDGVYLGEVKNLRSLMERGSVLVPRIRRVQRVQPVPGPTALKAKLLLDARFSPSITGQYKWIYIDRGTNDGVQPGMVFRFFQYRDPNNSSQITDSNMLVQGDVEVYQTCGNFSVGQVVWSKGAVNNETPALLLTDTQDYFTRLYLNGNISKAKFKELTKPDQGSDWLDGLNDGKDLTSDEDKELKQLENLDESEAKKDSELSPDKANENLPTLETNPLQEPTLPPLEGEEKLTPKAPEDAPLELPPSSNLDLEEPSSLIPTAPPANAEPSDIAL